MNSNEETMGDNCEVDFDSEHEEEIDVINPSTLQPYQFEPEKPAISSDEDDTSDRKSSSDEEDQDDMLRIGSTVWCTCDRCRCMSTCEESLCCKEDVPGDMIGELDCITDHEDFVTVCLNTAVLRTTLSMLNNLRGDNLTYDNISFRYAAYRQFTWWIHNRLGKGVRRVIPSCAIWAIRDQYPDQNDTYVPFREAAEEENRLV